MKTLSIIALAIGSFFLSVNAVAQNKAPALVLANDCAKLKLAGTYDCNMEEFGAFTLKIKQNKNTFDINAIFDDAEEAEGDVYVADKTRRGFDMPNRLDEYIATCTQKSLKIDMFLGGSPKTTGFMELIKTKSGVTFTRADLDSESGEKVAGLKVECTKKPAIK